MRQQYIEDIPIPLSLKNKKDINDDDIFETFSFTNNEKDFILNYINERFDEILSVV